MEILVLVLHILLWPLCLVLIGLILLQGGAGDVSSAFGGGGQLDTALGVGAGRKMAKLTGWLVVALFLFVIFLAIWSSNAPVSAKAGGGTAGTAGTATGADLAPPRGGTSTPPAFNRPPSTQPASTGSSAAVAASNTTASLPAATSAAMIVDAATSAAVISTPSAPVPAATAAVEVPAAAPAAAPAPALNAGAPASAASAAP